MSTRKRKEPEQAGAAVAASATGVLEMQCADGSTQSTKRQKISSHLRRQFKYHNFLPEPLRTQAMDVESAALRTHVMHEFTSFFSQEHILQHLHLKSNWEKVDGLFSKIRRFCVLKYPLEILEREQLCKTLYNVIVCSTADFAVQTKAATLIRLLLKKSEPLSITFPWRPLYELINKNHFTSSRTAIYTPRNHSALLISLVQCIKKYFDHSATDEIFEEFRPYFCVHDQHLFKAQGFLCTFLPTKTKRTDWYKELLAIWDWVGLYPTWDLLFMSLFASLAKNCTGLINWDDHLPFLFTRMLKCFDLPIGNAPLALYDEYPADECNLFAMFDIAKNMLLVNCAKLIVWMLSPGSNTMSYLKKLVKSIESFFHPSNEGGWTSILGDFLLTICMAFAKRLKMERNGKVNKDYCTTPEMCKDFVALVMPLALTAMYSKSQQMTSCANHALKQLAYLNPELVFPPLIQRCVHALRTLTETHQTVAALESLSLVIFPMVKLSLPHDGEKYLAEIMMLTLPGIDTNDLRKTWSTLKFYSSLLLCLPLVGNDNKAQEAEYDEDEFNSPVATRLSKSFVEMWCLQLLDRLFEVLYNQGPPKKEKTDTVSPELFWGVCDLLFTQLSDDLYTKCLAKVYDFVSKEFVINAKKNIGHLCSSVSYANPSKALALFVPMCYNRLVDSNQKLKHLTESELLWNLSILSQVIYRCGKELLPYRQELFTIIGLTLKSDDKPVVKTCGKLLKNFLRSLTYYYVKDTRSQNPSVWKSKDFDSNNIRYWGEFPELGDLEVDWHIPSPEEISLAVEISNRFLTQPISELKNYIQELNEQKEKTTINKKQVANHLHIIRYMIRGASILYPELKDDIIPGMEKYEGMSAVISGVGLVTEDKLSFPYSTICELLHSMTQALLKHGKDNTKILAILTKTFYPVLCMRGGVTPARYKKKHQSQNYVKQLNFKVHHSATKKYPRYLLVLRSVLNLKLRYALHVDSTPYTRMHSILIQDLVQLSLSSYAIVRKKAQNIIVSVWKKFSNKSVKQLLPPLIDVLSNRESSDEQITGAIYLLERGSCNSLILCNWDLLQQFLIAMCNTSHVEKPSIQQRLTELLETYLNSYYHIAMDENGKQQYCSLVATLVAQADKIRHWKLQMTLSSFLLILIRGDKSVLYPITGVKWFFVSLISDIDRVRAISIESLSMLLKQFKPIQPTKIVHFDKTQNMIEAWSNMHYPTTKEEWEHTIFMEKGYLGWYLNKPRLVVYSYAEEDLKAAKDPIAKEREQLQQDLLLLLTPEYVTKLFDLLTNREDTFSDSNMQFFKGMFQLFRGEFLELLKPHFEKLLSVAGNGKPEEAHNLTTAAEVVCGLFRGMKHWPFEMIQQAINYSLPLIDKVLYSCSVVCMQDWIDSLELAVCEQDPRRFGFLRDFLVEKLHKHIGIGSSATQLRYLKCAYFVFGEISWHDTKTMEQILSLLYHHLHHPYQQVREYISHFVSLALKTLWFPKRNEQNLPLMENREVIRPSVQQFFDKIKTEFDNVLKLKQSSQNGNNTPISSIASKPLLPLSSLPYLHLPQKKHGRATSAILSNSAASTSVVPAIVGKEKSTTRTPLSPKIATSIKAFEQQIQQQENPSQDLMEDDNPDEDENEAEHSNNNDELMLREVEEPLTEVVEQNIFKCLAKTVLTCIYGLFSPNSPHSALPFVTDLLNMVAMVQELSDEEELQDEARSAFIFIANYTFSQPYAKQVLFFLNDSSPKFSNWKVRYSFLDFLQVFGYRHQFVLMAEQQVLFGLIISLMKDPQLEVREHASTTLAGFLKISKIELFQQFSVQFYSWAQDPSAHRKRREHTSTVDTNLRHCGVLGLSAIVNAFPHDIPDFLPPFIIQLAAFSNDSVQPIRETVKRTFTSFWNIHRDVWFMHKEKFTEDQQLMLNELLISPSYYA